MSIITWFYAVVVDELWEVLDVALEKSFRENINTVDTRKQQYIAVFLGHSSVTLILSHFQGSNGAHKGVVGVQLKSKILLLSSERQQMKPKPLFAGICVLTTITTMSPGLCSYSTVINNIYCMCLKCQRGAAWNSFCYEWRSNMQPWTIHKCCLQQNIHISQ